jgi:hypothetical protein
MLGFIIITLIFISIMLTFSTINDMQIVKDNWEKYRCRPDVMLMANFYGHPTADNLEYCLKSGFDARAGNAIAPFYTYLGKFVEVLMTMLNSLNSIRMIFATIVGSATQIFSEFSGRIQALFYRFQMAAMRMKMLMGRVFATMYAIIFMGMSGIKATQNFGNTFLFKFLDTFCFDPDTPIILQNGMKVAIKDVKIGDYLRGGQKVTATFQFAADGQSMVSLPLGEAKPVSLPLGEAKPVSLPLEGKSIIVSTNHYIRYKSAWIEAKDHPDARPVSDWSGGNERPLICLNTDTHTIPIGNYIFSDYDETSEGDEAAMKMATDILNGKSISQNGSSEMAAHPNTQIKTVYGFVPAEKVILGTVLSHGTVVGIVKKECRDVCIVNNEKFAAGTCIWSPEHNRWMRAFELSKVVLSNPVVFYSFVVTPSASIETLSTIFRDYVEVHSKDLEAPYSAAIANVKTKGQTEC